MKEELIKAIVFDLGGVLIDWNPRHLYRKIFSDTQEMEFFLREICHSEWNEQQDAGRSFAEGCQQLSDKFPQYENEIMAYGSRWTEMLNGEISGTVEILQSLHHQNQYRLIALSNWSKETFPIAKKQFPFLDLFEGLIISGEIGYKKPDPKIYEHLFRNYGLRPEQCLFIDDMKRNTDAARKTGMHVIHFQSPTQLSEDLISYNLIRKIS
ncbi:MAG: HAD family phosphatase [Pseudomonadota bacterium]